MKKRYEIKNPSEILGKCYLCKKPVTKLMMAQNKAVYLGKNIYRCRSKKCQKTIIDNFLKRNKKLKKRIEEER